MKMALKKRRAKLLAARIESQAAAWKSRLKRGGESWQIIRRRMWQWRNGVMKGVMKSVSSVQYGIGSIGNVCEQIFSRNGVMAYQ